MIITKEIVLKKYTEILNGTLSYDAADRWAYKIISLDDEEKIIYEPIKDKDVIWELVLYLYGIDMPMVSDRTNTMICDDDIIKFLNKFN